MDNNSYTRQVLNSVPLTAVRTPPSHSCAVILTDTVSAAPRSAAAVCQAHQYWCRIEPKDECLFSDLFEKSGSPWWCGERVEVGGGWEEREKKRGGCRKKGR